MIPDLIRQAVRPWTTRPVLALTAVATLAAGVGTTTALFSVVDAVLLRPLPWVASEGLVSVLVARPHWRNNPVLAISWDRGNVSWPMWQDLRTKGRAFSHVAAWRRSQPTLEWERNELTHALEVSSEFLPMLGVAPHRGRFFVPGEDLSPSDAAIVSFECWQRRFGLAADVLGRRVTLDGTPRAIVGVLPPRFNFDGLTPPEFVLPIGNIPVSNRTAGNHFLYALARLAPRVTVAEAQRDADPHVRGAAKPEEKQARILPLAEQQQGTSTLPLWMLLGGSALLLLIACANVAGLLLGEAGSRRHEMAVRAALGGARRHFLRQLLSEAGALGAAAAAVGLVFAWWLTPVIVSMAPSELPRIADAAVDLRVGGFAGTLAVVTTLLFGTAPALALAAADPAAALRDGGRNQGLGRRRGQHLVVTLEVAIAVVLLTASALLGESFYRLVSLPVGFEPQRLAVVSPLLPRPPGDTAEARRQRTDALVARLAALPGVAGAAATSTAPFSGSSGSNSIEIEGRRFERSPSANRHIVTERYFEVLGIPVLKGRGFEPSDRHGAHVAVVSQEFERRYLDGDAIGRRFTLNGDVHQVVGVAARVTHREYDDEEAPAFYALNRQLPNWATPAFVVRTAIDPAAALPMIRQAIESAEPRAVIISLETMPAMMARSVADERFRTQLSVIFGATALVLAALGVYALIARDVADRRREIGVRIALGAAPGRVARMVLTQALMLVGIGLAIGVPVALAGSRVVESLLFGVSPTAPRSFALVVVVLAATAAAASLLPARRAARTDPIAVLRD